MLLSNVTNIVKYIEYARLLVSKYYFKKLIAYFYSPRMHYLKIPDKECISVNSKKKISVNSKKNISFNSTTVFNIDNNNTCFLSSILEWFLKIM